MITKKEKTAHTLKSIVYTLAIPVLVWVLFEGLDRTLAGVGVISTIADVKALLRTVLTSFCFALAINCNSSTGRMDLSLGAQMYMGCIFGGNIALSMGMGGVGILVLSMVVGGLSGLLVGVIFINMRILPMVLGIGMTLVFECVSFGAYNQQGLMLFGKSDVKILSDINFILVVAALLLIVMTFLVQYSNYGYKWRAIQGNQKLASDSGINIFTNCVQSYVIAGVLAGCAGVFDTAYKGSLTPVLGMSSNVSVFSNLFPLFLGIAIGMPCNNRVLGVLIGSTSIKILSLGLSKLAVSTSWQNIIIYTLFMLFNIYRINAPKLKYQKNKRLRIELAKQTRNARSLNAVSV